jgi:hypothetical protein
LADDVQAERVQDGGGGLTFEKELEGRPDEFLGGDLNAAEAGRESGRHADGVASVRAGIRVVVAGEMTAALRNGVMR